MKTLAIIKYTFAGIGLAMLVGAFFLYKNTSEFVSSATVVEGEVVDFETHRSDGSTMYAPVVNFYTKDNAPHQFVSSVSSNPASYDIGEKVEVLYTESNPQDAQINGVFSLYLGTIILSFIGGIFFLIGGGMILAGSLQNKTRAYLQTNGRPVQAKFQGVSLNESLSVNGRHPYVIIGQWLNPATNELHEFESDNIWFDPQEFIKSDTITVLIDPNNAKKYWMDISFLPKKA
jgi:Protein of unknown function (DUF3592)